MPGTMIDADGPVSRMAALGGLGELANCGCPNLPLALSEPPDTTTARAIKGSLGDLLRLRGHHDEALALLREASDFPPGTAPTSMWRPILIAQRSEAELDAGDAAAALASAQQALEFTAQAYAADDFRRGFALYALARAQLAAMKPGDAEALLRAALKLRQPPFPATHPRILELEVALVQALAGQGKAAEAQAERARIEPLLLQSSHPYYAELRDRLD